MYQGYVADRRLARRAEGLQDALVRHQSAVIAQVADTWAQQMAFYRLLGNERIHEADLIEGLRQHTAASVERLEAETPHLLAIQDTTQLNFQAHQRRLKPETGLGVIGDAHSAGFFLHPTLVLEATSRHVLGFSDVMLYRRDAGAPDKHARSYTRQPLEEKESLRWVQSLSRTRALLKASVRITGIADREGDLYPLFARLGEAHGTDLLVRACRDRRLEEGRLYAYLGAQPLLGREEVYVRGDVRKKRSGRWARLEYRSARITLRRPVRWRQESARRVVLWAVEVRESPETVPSGEEPIHWRLVTTHRGESLAQTRQIVGWYRERWNIEQIFRLLKLEGLDLERSELESGHALRRLAILALGASMDVLRLLLAERAENEQPLGQVFTAAEQRCLEALAQEVEGRTEKQRNPHPAQTLAWAAWVIARLGGWKGYRSQRAAGPTTYRRGLTRFALLCHGYHLSPSDVYTP